MLLEKRASGAVEAVTEAEEALDALAAAGQEKVRHAAAANHHPGGWSALD